CSSTAWRPSRPEEAVSTVMPVRSNARRKAWRMESSSSMTSSVGITSFRGWLNGGGNGASGHGQSHGETGPAVGTIHRRQSAAVVGGDSMGNRQSQSDACFLRADERIEQPGKEFGGNARPPVENM